VFEPLAVGLSSWIIQDGNYADFGRGKTSFAVEFYPLEMLAIGAHPNSATSPSLRCVADNRYAISGRVLHVAKDWWALDIGFGVYGNKMPPARAVPGASVQGMIALSIDHYPYFENFCQQPGAPPLIYSWQIQRIEIQTAPWKEVRPRSFERDPSHYGWREIERTDAWNDDDGHAEYLLHCIRQPAPPANRR
jgi:hypothetical protein